MSQARAKAMAARCRRNGGDCPCGSECRAEAEASRSSMFAATLPKAEASAAPRVAEINLAALKPCPFCGGPAVVEEEEVQGRKYFAVGCRRTGCYLRPFSTMMALPAAQATLQVLRWNQRKGVESR